MTNEELIVALRECANWIEAVAASSQYAHDELMALHHGDKLRAAANALEAAEQRIEELMPKEGEWIEDEYGYIHCSKCGMEWDEPEHPQTNFCPNCGARMRKGE
jgi:rubrerythrin